MRSPKARALPCLALAALAFLAGCATTGETDPRDPWEALNRKTFAFNEVLDRDVMKPVATAYEEELPLFMRQGINHFFDNLEDVGTSINQFLQGKPAEGFSDAGRFVINSTVGLLGLLDVATPAGLEKHNEDFGQTLGVWGVGPGPYFVIPFLGPSTLRDAPAKAVDPWWYYKHVLDNNTEYWSLWTLDKLRTRANLLKAGTLLEQAALDRYTFVRDAWLQRRRNQVYDGHPPREKEEE